jgi:hypothetical protein
MFRCMLDVPTFDDGAASHEDDTHIVHAGFIRHRIACWGFVVKEKDTPVCESANNCADA